MAEQKLSGKAVIITGSSAGIGAAIAMEMCRQGAQVTLHGRDEKKLNEVAKQCEQVSPGNKKTCIVSGDLRSEDVRKKLVTETVKNFGKLDVLVNNAGMMKTNAVEDVSLEVLDSMLDILVRVPYQLIKLAIPELIKNKGSVINISTCLSFRPTLPSLYMEYCMAKAALDQCTLWMARELGTNGIRVNSIQFSPKLHPGLIETEMLFNIGINNKKMEELIENVKSTRALGRHGKPHEVAKIAAFLSSSDASFVTGLLMRVDGGVEVMPTGPLTKV